MAQNLRTSRKGHDPPLRKGIDASNPDIIPGSNKFKRNTTTKGIGGWD